MIIQVQSQLLLSRPIGSTQNANLTRVTDCATNSGNSTKPVSILIDCISASLSLGIITSPRSVNITLTAGVYLYLAYVGPPWKSFKTH